MLVFEAVVYAGGGDRHAWCLISGEVSPDNLEVLYAYALARATTPSASPRLRKVQVTVTGTQNDTVLPEIARRLRQLEPHGVRVVVQ